MTVPRPSDPRPPRPATPAALRVAVDTAMAGLDGLDGRPPAEHVAAYERVHAALGDALAGGGRDDGADPRGA